ncbi:element excision factor XisH family protein [Allocoleopsis sp.]|uniref:element excision factor XisH family protein n=1 Tax=Allocoleopsis sp. TaxID=3088169 RepID=UPI002FD693E7
MPAKDIYHNAVVQSLKADGWTITHDPLYIAYGSRDLFVDLGAEREAIAAQKEGQKIAVEIKSFLSPSPVHDLQDAVGQYDIYRSVLLEVEPERLLSVAEALLEAGIPREAIVLGFHPVELRQYTDFAIS